MHLALYGEKLISLNNIERGDLQKLYIKGQQGQLLCPCCRQNMRLIISIHHPPIFIHPLKTFQCEEAILALENSYNYDKETKQVGGFTLPTHKKINDATKENAVTSESWRSPRTFSNIPPFVETVTKKAPTPYELDQSQWEAVSTTDGPLLVLAGAGSGKTRVLTSRTAHMLLEKNIPANRILLVTFTSKAAAEMKERMNAFQGVSTYMLKQLVVGTFHSIFYKMLLHHQSDLWQPNKLLKWDWQREGLIKQAAREQSIDEKEFAFDQALAQISYWKNQMQYPNEMDIKNEWDEQVNGLYRRYEEMKREENLFDFDDMLLGCYSLLTENHDLLNKYQQRFSYILVDEFQDINKVQYEIVKLLAGTTKHLCAVGDDDQAIYSFRGSDPAYILNFKKDFPNAKTVTLNYNYRSPHSVVSLAQKMIVKNKLRVNKVVNATKSKNTKPVLFFPYDEEEEATMIVHDIVEKIENGAKPNDFAILYRTNSTARAIFERLVSSSLPFQIYQDGESFYARRTVRKAIAYLKLTIDEDDPAAIGELLGALFLKQSKLQDLKALSILNDCSLLQALTKLDDIQPFQKKKLMKIIPLFKRIRDFNTVDALEWIEKEMGLNDYLKKHGNEGNAIEKGSDDLRDLKVAASSHESIASFLQHVDHMMKKAADHKKIAQNKPSISVMTIHRAKGLEFNNVYILSATEGSLPHDYSLEALREGNVEPLEEERRLMYVTVTRAMKHLYISVPQRRHGKKAYPSRFIKEMNQK